MDAKGDELFDLDDKVHEQDENLLQLKEIKKGLAHYQIKDLAMIRRRESVIMDRNLLLFHPQNVLDKD